ncbi:hypothetical protein RU639_006824 [Aspergillus parasiticus]
MYIDTFFPDGDKENVAAHLTAKDSSIQINALITKVTSAVSNVAAQSPKEQVTVETPITKPAMEGLTSPDRLPPGHVRG